MTEEQYPESEKLLKVLPISQAQGEFLEWLSNEEGITLCREDGCNEFTPVHDSFKELLARYHGIDMQKVEQEREVMLNSLRAASAAG